MAVMLLEWASTSVFLILVVLALRAALGRRMSAGLRYALWAVVLVRLLVPVQLFTSPIGGLWVAAGERTEREAVQWPIASEVRPPAEPGDVLSLSGQNASSGIQSAFPQAPDPPAVPNAPEPPDLDRLPGWTAYLGWAWLAGSAAAALVLLWANVRFWRRLRQERVPLDGAAGPLRAYVVTGLPSPCLFGILRPAVYVTPEAAVDPDMLRHVLAHEHTHYRHGDHLWSFLRCAALAVHWWDPLVWAAAVLSQRDAELACDEGALKRLGDGERAGYGNTLLTLVTAKPRPGDLFRCATTMAGDKKSLKERIGRIACAPKRILWAAAAAVLVTALACVCAFGQAKPVEPEDDVDGKTALSFSIDENGLVEIAGTVDGLALQPGTFWQPTGAPANTLTMSYAPFDGDVEGILYAWWEDGGRTAVTLNTSMMAAFSSQSDAGFWTFTVDLADGTVTYMAASAGMPAQTDPDARSRLYPGSISDEEAVRAARIAAALLTAAEDYYRDQRLAEPAGFPQNDLDRDGVPETLCAVDIDGGMGQRLEVWEDDQLLWADEAYSAHVGWNSIFLCSLDGEGYLLRYHPTMYQGYCTYNYRLFTLENGVETVVKENDVEFDINFHPMMHQSFDPEAIAAFMEEVNGLLANSVQLLNTDPYLLEAFEEEGRLYDSLWWLDDSEGSGFVRDEGKSLLENLRGFKAAEEKGLYAETPEVFPVDELGTDIQLRYQDKTARFESPGWDYGFQPTESVGPQVLDLDGDGRDEIVFVLVEGRGTGCLVEALYVFDAGTLEQYDTSGLNMEILGSIRSAGDEENFYLSGPGMDQVAIPKGEAREKDEGAPVAERMGFGDYIVYTIQDGGISCWVGCDASGYLTNYIGLIQLRLGFDPGSASCFRYTAQYVESLPDRPLF